MLAPCPACGRHAREPACPFCGARIAPASSPARGPRVSRTVKILGAAALGVACGGTTSPSDGGADATDDIALQPPYGAVIPDAGGDAAQGSDAADADASDAGDAAVDSSGVPLYGAPPPDGG